MLPTSYRGNATIDGEIIDAVLRLDEGHLRLTTRADAQILRWPLSSLEVESTGEGEYRLEAGDEHFAFAPLYDDGLGVEIALRRRFVPEEAGSVMTAARVDPDPPVAPAKVARKQRAGGKGLKGARDRRAAHLAGEDALTIDPGPVSRKARKRQLKKRAANPVSLLTVADQAVGRASTGRRRRGVLNGGDLGLGTAVLVLALLAAAIGTVAWLSGSSSPQTVVVLEAPEPTESTLPFTEPEPGPNAPEVVAPAVTPTTEPPTQTTVTTAPPTTVTTQASAPAPAGSPFDLETIFNHTPADLAARWDAQALAIEPGLATSGLTTDGDTFTFAVGDYVVVNGTVDPDGTIGNLEFLGDPSGDVDADRRVLASLGLTVAMFEPELPPLGRRKFLSALGLDIDKPDLAGLDDELAYNERFYRLRWDPDRVRLVLTGSDSPLPGTADTDEGADTP